MAPKNDADARFDEFAQSIFHEYSDRDLRFFFAQLLAVAELSEFVAMRRDEIYEVYYRGTFERMRALAPDFGVDELHRRICRVVALLEGLHAVTVFKAKVMQAQQDFQRHLMEEAKRLGCGLPASAR